MTEETKELTDQEKLFLDLLFDPSGMKHPNEAKQLAGYPKEYPVLKLVRNISKELIQRCDDYLAMYAPQGLAGLMEIMLEPNNPGSKIKLQAVVELLDRAGVVKKEKTEVSQATPSYVFMLPAKQSIDEKDTK